MSLDLAVFMPSFQGGGAEKVAVHVANELARRGRSLAFVVGSASGPYLAAVSPDVRVVDLGVPLGGGGFARTVLPLARFLRGERPGRLLGVANEANLVALLAGRLAGYRGVVASEHTHLSRALAEFSAPKRRVLRGLTRALYPRAAAIIAIARVAADDLATSFGLPSERLSVVYNPVLPDADPPAPASPWPRPYLLSVGRLAPPKDYDTLLRAFSLCGLGGHDLVLLGEGPQKGVVEELARELGLADRVHLVGFADPAPYFAHADGVVLSSRFEGLPNVLVEALSHRANIVATDIPGGGPGEALGNFGRTVPIGDPVRLALALNGLPSSARPGGAELAAHLASFRRSAAVDGYERVLFGNGIGTGGEA